MVHPLFRKRASNTPAPDYSGKAETLAFLRKEKKGQEEADYRPASGDSKKRCHECASYQKPGDKESSCAKVIGVVVAEGVCDLWTQRDYSSDPVGTKKPPTEITIRLG